MYIHSVAITCKKGEKEKQKKAKTTFLSLSPLHSQTEDPLKQTNALATLTPWNNTKQTLQTNTEDSVEQI